MGKIKTSGKRKAYSRSTSRIREDMGIDRFDPTAALLDEELIGRAIWECLKEGDSEGVIEIIQIHLEVVNKVEAAKAAKISKSTLYHSLRSKNPTIKTLAKLVHACV